MTYEDWVISTSSKAKGSWNLHEILPRDLDFFVIISSVNGIFGSRGQANYAAGNTFKDGLAHYRISLGQKAVSIDLGLMVNEGAVAENPYLMDAVRRVGHLMDIQDDEFIALMDRYCDARLPLLSQAEAQVLVGIETASAVRAKGIDLHHSMYRPMFRPMFRHLFRTESHAADGTNSSPHAKNAAAVDRPTVLKQAASPEQAASLVTGWLRGKMAHFLGVPEADIDVAEPLAAHGIDSLMAIDLKNWFAREIGADIEVFALLNSASLEELAAGAAEKSRYRLTTPTNSGRQCVCPPTE